LGATTTWFGSDDGSEGQCSLAGLTITSTVEPLGWLSPTVAVTVIGVTPVGSLGLSVICGSAAAAGAAHSDTPTTHTTAAHRPLAQRKLRAFPCIRG
jgi:hypothetical protein